jgi:hypothetical protein
MKNVFLTFVFALLINQAHSQPEILSNEMPPIGTVMTYKTILFNAPIDTSIYGVNSIWDYSGLIADSVDDIFEIVVDPVHTPQGSIFPGSNFCLKKPGYTDTIYDYFSLSNQSLERIGTMTQSYLNIYSNYETILAFPLSMYTYSQDSSVCTYDSAGSSYSFECIGTGLLMLPSGNYNAILIRVQKASSTSPIVTDFYYWYDADNGVRLLTYDNGDPYVRGGTPCTFLHTHTISIEEPELISEFLYSNPIKNSFNFQVRTKMSGHYEFTVFNETGQVIQRSETNLTAGLSEKFQLDFQNKSSGFYLFSILNSKTRKTVKSVKLFKH